MTALRAEAAAGVRWTGLSSVFNAVTDVIRIVVLARFLSPLDYGLMAMVWIVIGFSQMYMDLGVSAAIVQREENTKEQLSSLYWLNIFLGLTVFCVIWLCTPWIPLFFREPKVVPLLRVASVVFLIVPIGSQFEILLQKTLSFKVLAKWEMVASLCSTLVAVICAVSGFGVWALLWSFLTNVSVKTCLLVRVGFTRFRPSFHFRRSDLKGYVGFGLFQMGERSINYIAEKLDQMLIGPLLGAEALGLYNFALYLTSQPVARINPILTKVAFPLFSRIQHDTERLKRGYLQLVSLISTVNSPLLIGLATVAPWVVPAIFGTKWSASVALVQILSIVSLSRSINNPIGSLQLAKGRADLGFWWNVLLLVLSIPAIYVGGKLGQAKGVAIALLLLQICLNVPAYLLLVRPLIGKCAPAYVAATMRPVAFAAVMALMVWSLGLLLRGFPVKIEIAAKIVGGGLAYISLMLAFNSGAVAQFQSIVFGNRAALVSD